MKPKILLISTIPGIPRVHRAANTFAAKCDVMVLEWDRDSVLPKHEKVNYGEIHRFKFKAPYGLNLIFKLPFWMIYLALFCSANDIDIIAPQNLDTLLPIWIIAKLKRKTIIYDMADFYADAYIPIRFKVIRRIIACLEIFLIDRVDAVIIPNESLIEQIGNIDRTRVFVVYNSPYDKYDCLSSGSAYDTDLSKFVSSHFTLFYGGVISSDRGLDHLVEAVTGIPDIRLLVAGYGPADNEFRDLIKDKQNIMFLGKVQHVKILQLTYLSNCVITLYDPIIPTFVHASPNKLFEAMMCGKPIIAIKGTYMSRVVTEENCGLLIDSKNVEKIRIAISTLKNNPELATELGKNGRMAFIARYNWSLMEKTLLAVLETANP